METLSIPAHYDGSQILLDEPIALEPNAKLLVTVLPEQDKEREAWLRLSAQSLAGAFSATEPEYNLDAVKELNPDYEGR